MLFPASFQQAWRLAVYSSCTNCYAIYADTAIFLLLNVWIRLACDGVNHPRRLTTQTNQNLIKYLKLFTLASPCLPKVYEWFPKVTATAMGIYTRERPLALFNKPMARSLAHRSYKLFSWVPQPSFFHGNPLQGSLFPHSIKLEQ